MSVIEAATAVKKGELVIFPTETVYGLGGDALSPSAIERVFEAKGRAQSEAMSMALAEIDDIDRYAAPSSTAMSFIRTFLPGPVTPLVPKKSRVPDILTANRDTVGIRIPDHELALELLPQVGPITSTSANISGNPSASQVSDLDEITRTASVTLDGGHCTVGVGSTVVNTQTWEIVRAGAHAEEVDLWIDENVD